MNDLTTLSENKPWRNSQKNNLATQPEKQILATQPEKQPGDTARKTTLTRPGGLAAHNGLEGHLHRESAIECAPPQIGFPPHQILNLHHLISQNSGLEVQKQARGHLSPKLATDGVFPKFTTFTHTTRLIPNHHELDQPTT